MAAIFAVELRTGAPAAVHDAGRSAREGHSSDLAGVPRGVARTRLEVPHPHVRSSRGRARQLRRDRQHGRLESHCRARSRHAAMLWWMGLIATEGRWTKSRPHPHVPERRRGGR